jgi:hypothetical protein
MQAGRLLEIKLCGINGVALALDHHDAHHNIVYVQLRSNVFNDGGRFAQYRQ